MDLGYEYNTIFVCLTYMNDGLTPRVSTEGSNRVRVSYTYNMYCGAYDPSLIPGTPWWRKHLSLDRLAAPSSKAYFIDGLRRNASNTWYAAETGHFTVANLMNRHPSESNNMLFFDGHATGRRGDDILVNISNTNGFWLPKHL